MHSQDSARNYALIATGFVLVAIYGSLVPFEFTPLSLEAAFHRFQTIPYLQLGIGSRADWVSNILLFLPIGYFSMAALTVDRRRSKATLAAAVAVIIAGAIGSSALEFIQLWFPARTVSRNDIVAETLGATAGVTLWTIWGQPLTEWLRSYAKHRRAKDQIDWLLQAYLFGFVVYSILPLDLTISLTELLQKYREGKISVMPFARLDLGYDTLYNLVRDIVLFVPIGMLAATWNTVAGHAVRPVAKATLLGGMIAATIEFGQLLVYSRYSSTDDIILATVGIWIGATIMHRYRGGAIDQSVLIPLTDSSQQFWRWIFVILIYSGFLVLISCAPFDLLKQPGELKIRYLQFFQVPFAAMYRGTEFNAVSTVLKDIILYVPLGVLFVLAMESVAYPVAMRQLIFSSGLCAVAGLATIIELLQVAFPPRVPDITDVILCTFGSAVGMAITARMVDKEKG